MEGGQRLSQHARYRYADDESRFFGVAAVAGSEACERLSEVHPCDGVGDHFRRGVAEGVEECGCEAGQGTGLVLSARDVGCFSAGG